MEIKIDTKRDSADDIKKMIAFLQHFISESSSLNPYSSPDNVPSANELPTGAFNLFDSPPSSKVSPPSDPEDDSDEIPEIEPY
ncbi:MAG: hypothetical protein ABIE94_01410 [archaeon]